MDREIPPFIKEQLKKKTQTGKSSPEGDIPPFLKKKDETNSYTELQTSQPVSPAPSNDMPTPISSPAIGIASSVAATAIEGTTTTPSIFAEPAKQTIFDKPFLDRDIEKKFDLSLSDPALNKPAYKYSLLNDYYKKKQNTFDARKEVAKADIKKDAGTLAEYNMQRIAEINSDVSDIHQKLKDLAYTGTDNPETARQIELGTIKPEDVHTYGTQVAELNKEIAHALDYKEKLKGAVAQESIKTIVPQYIAPGKTFDAVNLGRDIMKVSDPEMELQFRDAEKGNSGLPPLQKANLERLGVDAAKSYLQTQPQTEDNIARIAEITSNEKTFDERNVELTAQRVREKLGVYFYNKGNSGLFGYKNNDVEKGINDPKAGLTPDEIKVGLNYVLPIEKRLAFSTEIPGSGFFRSGIGAIERSITGLGDTISGQLGDRTDAQRAYENLNAEIEQSRFRKPGENPSMQSELARINKREAEKGGLSSSEKTRKAELEKLVDVRSGLSKFLDGSGDLTGQVIQMALLTKGVGAAGELATSIAESGGILSGGMTSSAIGAALSNETVGLFLNSYFQTYDNYRSQAMEIMPGEKNASNRKAYASTMAFVEGASEKIFNDVKVLKAFTNGVAPSVADITSRFVNKEITQEVARRELSNAFVNYAKPFAKEFAKTTFQESFEEGIVDIADGVAQSVFGGQAFDIRKTGAQAINTFLTTALYSPFVSGMASHGAARENANETAFYKTAIVDMARQPVAYLQSVDKLLLNGTINQEQANEKIKLINSSQKYLAELPKTVTMPMEKGGFVTRQLDFPEISSYLTHRLNEGILTDQQEKVKSDPVAVKNLQTQIDRSVAIRQGIADGQIGITPNNIEVTDDEKTAKDLGISMVNEVHPDDLIGTKFQAAKHTPEQVIIEAVHKGNLEGIYSDMVKANPATAKDVILDLAMQKYGIQQDGSESPAGGRDISMKTSLAVDDAVTSIYPNKESVITAIKNPTINETKTETANPNVGQSQAGQGGTKVPGQQVPTTQSGQTNVPAQTLAPSEGAAQTTASSPISENILSEKLPVDLKYQQVSLKDVVTGETSQTSVSKAQKLIEKRHEILDKFVNCLTK